MFTTLSSQELAEIKKDYTIKEAYIPEPDWKEIEEMDRMRRKLYEKDADKFLEIENITTDDYRDTEEYIESLREISGLY